MTLRTKSGYRQYNRQYYLQNTEWLLKPPTKKNNNHCQQKY